MMKGTKSGIASAFTIALVPAFVSCAQVKPPEPSPQAGSGWETVAETFVEKADTTHACLVMVDGTTVFEAYAWPCGPGDRHKLASFTKSVLSVLVGITVGEAKIPSLDAKPGTRFYYNSGASHLLSGILQKDVGKTARDYAAEKLFSHLGITDFFWGADRNGVTMGCSGLQLTARQLATIGRLLLARGEWDGRRIVSAAWIDESTTKQVDTSSGLAGRYGYGYQWWMNPSGGFSGRGYGGQYLLVDPKRKIVAVFFGSNFDDDFFMPERLLAQAMVPAAEKGGAKVDVALASRLAALAQAAGKGPTPVPPAPLPAKAAAISGRRILLSDGSASAFTFPKADEAVWTMETGGSPGSFPMGLDGRFRSGFLGEAFGLAPPNPVFARGGWEGEDVLRAELTLSYDSYTYVFRFRFPAGGTVEESCFVPELGQ
ncbi:MAG: serine hydrolase [Spirochaetes bacterium]|nr:serine hydrolase [Spirochaetota bacterium]